MQIRISWQMRQFIWNVFCAKRQEDGRIRSQLLLAGLTVLILVQMGMKSFRLLFHQSENVSGKEERTARLKEMLILVDEAERVLTDRHRKLDEFGRLLDYTWKLKRKSGSAVSSDSIDELYSRGINAGALGGKLLGAGGGGFLIFYVQPEYQESVRRVMNDLMYIPFSFENGGTRVIHYTPETYDRFEK